MKPNYSKEILKLTTPVMIAMLAQAFINQVDSIMVGQLDLDVATPGQAAIGITLKLLWVVGGFLSAIGIGALAMVSRRYGERDFEGVSTAVSNSIFISVISSIILSIIAIIFTKDFIQMITTEKEIIHYGVPYLQIRLTGVLSMVVTATYKSYFDGLKVTHVHMVASIVMNIANIIVNWILIFGKLGFPAMGVNGAALASAICTYIGLGIMIIYSFKKEYKTKFKIYNFKLINLKTSMQVIKLSFPAGAATIILMTGFILFDKIVAQIEGNTTNYLAVSQLIMNFILVLAMIGLSFGTVAATLVGNSLGEKKPEWASKYGWKAVELGIYFMLVLGIIVLISPEFVISWYNTDPAIIALGKTPFRIIGSSIPFIAVGLILSQAHFGAGNNNFVMIAQVTLHFGFLVPASALAVLVFDLGLNGAWVAAAMYMVLLAAVMGVTFWKGKWKNIKV